MDLGTTRFPSFWGDGTREAYVAAGMHFPQTAYGVDAIDAEELAVGSAAVAVALAAEAEAEGVMLGVVVDKNVAAAAAVVVQFGSAFAVPYRQS